MSRIVRYTGTGNVLYLGMADDIISLLLLAPNADTYFIIDTSDYLAYSDDATMEGLREKIRMILREGTNRGTKLCRRRQNKLVSLPDGPATLGQEVVVASQQRMQPKPDFIEGGEWRLEFEYGGKQRRLVCYYSDFLHKWPAEVVQVAAIMGFGAFSFEYLSHPEPGNVLRRMLETRTTPIWSFYLNHWSWMGEHFPIQFPLERGGYSDYNDVSLATVNRTDTRWFSKLLPPRRPPPPPKSLETHMQQQQQKKRKRCD